MSITFYKTQKEAFEYADNNNLDLIITHAYPNKNNKLVYEFSAIHYKHYNKFISYIENNDDITKYSTMIRDGQKDRMRLDIEVYITNNKYKKLANLAIQTLLQDVQLYLDVDDIEYIESDNSRPVEKEGFVYKVSKHIIYPYYFDSTKHQKQFWLQFLEQNKTHEKISNDKLSFDFDMSVYNTNSQWNETKRTSDSSVTERCPTYISDDCEHIAIELPEEDKQKQQKTKKQIIKDESDNEEEDNEEEDNKKKIMKNQDKLLKSKREEIIELCDMLSIARIDNYDTWKDLIFCLSCISYTKEMEKIAIEVSKKSKKSNSGTFTQDFKNIWTKSNGKSFSIGSLHYWAKQDNPDLYNKYIATHIKPFESCMILQDEITNDKFDNILKCDLTEHGIAKLIKDLIGDRLKIVNDKLVYTVNKYNVWYETDISSLLKMISYDIIYMLTKAYYENIGKNNNEKDKELGKIFIILSNIKTGKTLKDILVYLKPIMTDTKFSEKLDLNTDLLSFNDKVVNLVTKEIRDIKRTDYISITTGYNYPTTEMKYKEEIMTFFEQIHNNSEQREFLLQQLAQSLSGRTGNQTVLTHAGKDNSGGNGKSKLFELNKKAFGKYSYCMPSDILYSRVNYNPQAPRPDIIHLKGKRLVYCSEPDAGQKLNMSWIKHISGGDPISGRLCHSNVISEFEPQLHLNILCNKKLECDAFDGGWQRRNKVIEYTSKFTPYEKDVDTENNIYLMDTKLEDKISLWRNDYIRILIERYDSNYKFSCPEIVLMNSQKYLDSNNSILLFKEKYLEESKGFITINQIKEKWRNDKDFEKMKQSDFISSFKTVFSKDFYERKKINGKDYRNVILNCGFQEDNEDNNECEIDD